MGLYAKDSIKSWRSQTRTSVAQFREALRDFVPGPCGSVLQTVASAPSVPVCK